MKFLKFNNVVENSTFVFPILFIILSTFLTTSVLAQDPIQTRKELMGDNLGAIKIAAGMAKGDIAFDAQKAELAMRTMNAVSLGFGNYFGPDMKPPADSKTTFSASPEIWNNMDGFKAQLAQFRADTSAAIKAAGSGEADWKAAFGKVAKNCATCHQNYRVKNN